MRKIKNKKMATVVVAFLMVFVMAGAFATFQALLDIRARVNLFAPTVDAIFATFGQAPDGWTGPNFNTPATTGRTAPVTLSSHVIATANQGVIHVATGGTGGAGAWSFNWGDFDRQGPEGPILNAGGIPVSDHQTIYLQVAFDNFGQVAEFDFSLANQGPVPLRIDNVVVEPVAASVVGADITDDGWAYDEVLAQIDARVTTNLDDFITVAGMFNQLYADPPETTAAPLGTVAVAHPAAANNTQRFGLRNFVMPPVQSPATTANRSPLTNIRFFVTPAQWNTWQATLTELELNAAELVSRDITFRITYTVVPVLS